MLALIQRVSDAAVAIGSEITSEIRNGLLVFLGIKSEDDENEAKYLAAKSVNLRIFNDENGKMNLSLFDINGELLVVSQFTLHADTKHGNRPSFTEAAPQPKAEELYKCFVNECRNLLGHQRVAEGRFRAMMKVKLINDGPVTIMLRSKNEY
jgi:D-tyrosyl-tRNA(Tyr) deacylase